MTTAAEADFRGTRRFEVLRRVGEGGAGVVYEARDRELGTHVALKVLRAWDADALLRFKNEFRALQEMVHPNLVSLGELFEEEGEWFFTMEFVFGTDFLSHVSKPVPLPPPSSPLSDPGGPASAVHVARTRKWREEDAARLLPFDEDRLRSALGQLARAVCAVHRAGMVHRDVKPSNILVTPEGRVVLLDFGLVAEAPREPGGRDARRVIGTAAYMAPEQAAGEAVGPQADWYSVGVVLYRALTGGVPFPGPAVEVLKEKQLREPLPPALEIPGIPRDLDELCAGLLHIDPAARPTGIEVLRRLNVRENLFDSGHWVADPVPSTQAPPFVGRERELARLRQAYERTREEGAVAASIRGESGVGKTSLARTFTRSLAAEGATVLHGRCYERESVPFKAFDGLVDELSQHLTRMTRAEATERIPPSASLLVQVFPVLRKVEAIARPGRAPIVADPIELRTRVFAAMRELLGRLAQKQPLVLVIDDLQWSDPDSLALLREIMRPPDAPRLLLLSTVREDEPTRGGARPGAPSPGHAIDIHLPRLEERHAYDLALSLLRHTGGRDEATASTIAREAEGHPLFIDELVRHRLLVGPPADGPEPLEEALWRRISSLDADARRILELVAVAGIPLAAETAAQAATMEFGDFSSKAAFLRAAHLVRTTGARRTDRIEPYHDRVRAAVVMHLAGDVQRAWHGRLAVALEGAGNADPELLAFHWNEAGTPDRAARYAIAAAERAAATLAFDRSARLYRFALSLRPPDDPDVRALRWKLGDALAKAGRGAEAAEAFFAAAAGATAADALELRRRAAEALLISGYIDEGLAALESVLSVIGMKMPRTTGAAIALLLARRARIRLRGLSYRERDPTEVSARDLRRIDLCWSVAQGLGMADTLRGAVFQAQHMLLALDAGEPFRVMRAFFAEAAYSSTGGGNTLARTELLLAKGRDLVGRVGTDRARALALGVEMMVALLHGRWRVARALWLESDALFRETCTDVTWELDTGAQYGLAALVHLGELAEVRARMPVLVAEAEERGDRYQLAHLRTGWISMVWLAADDPVWARAVADESRAAWARGGVHLTHVLDLVARAQIDLYEGKADEALLRLRDGWGPVSDAQFLRVQFVRLQLLWLRARTAVGAAELPGANRARLLREAERDAARIESEAMPWSDPLAKLVRAGVARARGKEARAAALLLEAARGFDAADMGAYAAVARYRHGAGRAEAEAWMRAHGIVAPEKFAALVAPMRGD